MLCLLFKTQPMSLSVFYCFPFVYRRQVMGNGDSPHNLFCCFFQNHLHTYFDGVTYKSSFLLSYFSWLSPLIQFETTFLQKFSKILVPDYDLSTHENGWFIFWFHTMIWWMITILIGDIYRNIHIRFSVYFSCLWGWSSGIFVLSDSSQQHGDTTKTK